MKFYTAFLTVLLAFAFLGCSTPATKTAEEKTDPAKAEKKDEKLDAKQSTDEKTEATPATDDKPATEVGAFSSPKETVMTFVAALQKKDGAAIAKCMSKAAIANFEKEAKEEKKSLEDYLVEFFEDEDEVKIPETKNEKIDGDSATIEVKEDGDKEWTSIPFAKEDGGWKMAFDKIGQ